MPVQSVTPSETVEVFAEDLAFYQAFDAVSVHPLAALVMLQAAQNPEPQSAEALDTGAFAAEIPLPEWPRAARLRAAKNICKATLMQPSVFTEVGPDTYQPDPERLELHAALASLAIQWELNNPDYTLVDLLGVARFSTGQMASPSKKMTLFRSLLESETGEITLERIRETTPHTDTDVVKLDLHMLETQGIFATIQNYQGKHYSLCPELIAPLSSLIEGINLVRTNSNFRRSITRHTLELLRHSPFRSYLINKALSTRSHGNRKNREGFRLSPERGEATARIEHLARAVQSMKRRRPAWQSMAACTPLNAGRKIDPEVFFPIPPAADSKAKTFCKGCPVSLDCLHWALGEQETTGVLGNTNALERAWLTVQLSKARPIKR